LTTIVTRSVLEEYAGTKLLHQDQLNTIRASSLPSKPVEVAFREALATPVGAKPLDRERAWSPAIIFADYTRKYSPFIPTLLNILEQKTDDIKLICAGGTHTQSDPSFVRKVVGEDIYKRYQKSISISTTKNPGCKYEWIGITTRGTPVELNKELFDRDLLISSMNVQPHYFAGYEGGAKALLPGCAGLKTIATNHGYVVGDPNCRELVMKGNVVREDLNEVPGILRDTMKIEHRILDFVLNQDGSMVKALYGDAIQAHNQLAENYSRRIHTAQAPKSPLVLTVADGPMGLNLYQSLKASAFATSLSPSDHHPKPVVVLLAPLEQGLGGDAFRIEMETYGKMEPQKVIEDLKRRVRQGKVTEASQKPNRLSLDDGKADIVVVSPKAPAVVEQLLGKTRIKFYRSLDEALAQLDKSLYTGRVGFIPFGSSTVPIPTGN
jgi:nickel-dependent lactate racemase